LAVLDVHRGLLALGRRLRVVALAHLLA
jgi:hypothetical protein